MDDIVRFTRGIWAGVPRWIADKDYWVSDADAHAPPDKRAFRYGLPPHVRHLIDLPINDEPTEADVLCHLLPMRDTPVRYLEIGVSVGKTLLAVSRFVAAHLPPGSTVTGVDIEPTNPTLHALLTAAHGDPVVEGNATTWGGGSGGGCAVTYVQGDEFDPAVWDALRESGPFDVIFSDAQHDPAALEAEYSYILRHKLIDPAAGFTYCFDDLDTRELLQAVEAIAVDMGHRFPDMRIDATLTHTPGWLGQHEYVHNFGIIRATPP